MGRTYDLVPPGGMQRRRVYVACRFPDGAPAFTQAPMTVSADREAAARQQQQQQQQQRGGSSSAAGGAAQQRQLTELVLSSSKQQQHAGANAVAAADAAITRFRGIPRSDASGGNYFLLTQAGKGLFAVHPLSTLYTFKRSGPNKGPQSVDELEAQLAAGGGAAAAGGGGGAAAAGPRLLPKSVRQRMAEAVAADAAERRLQEEAAPLLKPEKVAELRVRYGDGGAGGGGGLRGRGGRSDLVLGASDDDEDHSDEELEDGDDEAAAAAAARRRALSRDKKASSAAASGKGGKRGRRGAGGGPELNIPDDELAEDIYAGEEDELRPAAPTEDVDWEFQDDAADDDLAQGASDEEGLDDDPGLRKKLGIDPTDEEAAEDAKRQAGLAAEPEPASDAAKAAADAAAAAAAAVAAAAAGGAGTPGGPASMDTGGGSGLGDEDEFEDDEDDDADEEYDDDALEALAESVVSHLPTQPASKRRRAGSLEPGGRERSPAPLYAAAAAPRGSTPPPGAGGSRGTPPARRGSTPKVSGGARRTPPPGPSAAAAAAAASAGAGKRKRDGSVGRQATPPPAPSAAAAAAAAAPPPSQQHVQPELDARGLATPAGIRAVMQQMGPVPLGQISVLLARLGAVNVGEEVKRELKARVLKVAKVESINGERYITVAPHAPGAGP